MENKRIYQRGSNTTIAYQNADITVADFPFKIWIEGNTVCIENVGEEEETVLHNDRTISIPKQSKVIPFERGDSFRFRAGSITLFDEEIEVDFAGVEHTVRLLEKKPDHLPFEGFPAYKRSPRLIKKVPTEKIEISRPPEKKKKEKGSLVQLILMPLVMLCVTVSVSILMKRGIFVIVSAISTVMSLVFSVYRYIQGRKEDKEKETHRQDMYDKYLLSVRKRIYHAYEKEIDAITYNNPDVQSIEKMVNEYSSRIYERNVGDSDFLSVAVGTAKEPVSFPITMQYKELDMEPDELEQEAVRMKQKFSYIEDKPVTVDLKQAHLGLVGEKDVIHEQLKLLIAQLTFFHSYHELEIINIFHEKYDSEFKWMNWYPHLHIHSINVVGCINNERMRDHVLGSVYRILKERKQRQEESRKESRFLPHFLFVIDEPKLTSDHAIMEYLDKEGDNLGFSAVGMCLTK